MAEGLQKRTVNGLVWSTVERFSTQSVSFILGVFIARILTPDDYGTIAILSIFFAVSNTFIDSGFSSALVRKTDRTESDKATVFYFNIGVSAIIYTLLFFAAPYIAEFFEIPILTQLTRAIGVNVILNSLCIVQQAILTARIDFKLQAKITLSAAVISGVTGLTLAYMGYGVWALAIQMIVGSLVRAILLWLLVRWRPVRPFSRDSFKELFGYGSKLLASGLIDTLYKNIYEFVIGKLFKPASLGFYTRAKQYSDFASSNITGIIQRVTFPVLCTIQDDDVRLATNYRKILRLTAFVVFPMMLGLSALAQPVIITILTDKWADSVPFLQVVCFSMMWYPIHAINLNLLQVKGRSDLFLRLEIIKKMVGVTILCITIPQGILVMCYGQIVSSMIALIINTYYTGKLINVGYIKQMGDLLPIFAMSFAMWGLIRFVLSYIESDALMLIVGIPLGFVFYLGVAYLSKSIELKSIIEIIKSKKL